MINSLQTMTMTHFHTVSSPYGTTQVPSPESMPAPGAELKVVQPFATLGSDEDGNLHVYNKGDILTLLRRTEDAPYGYKSSLGNWEVLTKYGLSVWSGIDSMIAMQEVVVVNPNE